MEKQCFTLDDATKEPLLFAFDFLHFRATEVNLIYMHLHQDVNKISTFPFSRFFNGVKPPQKPHQDKTFFFSLDGNLPLGTWLSSARSRKHLILLLGKGISYIFFIFQL